ncbi:MAG: hypothetical protein JETCAE03_32440 [Ignavibacteriaceae bacterium]|nr:MAG: hypothetical protein JETCAE03_32440 [Ignavibacteriaceae bacterium]
MISKIEKRKGKICPNYNPIACKIIDEYGQKHGCHFQHAENGGEVCIDGYFPDGIDEKNKIIIEVDEKHHAKTKNKDLNKQKYFEKLGYKVIRIKLYE